MIPWEELVDRWLRESWRIVEAAELPDALQPVAFEAVLRAMECMFEEDS